MGGDQARGSFVKELPSSAEKEHDLTQYLLELVSLILGVLLGVGATWRKGQEGSRAVGLVRGATCRGKAP